MEANGEAEYRASLKQNSVQIIYTLKGKGEKHGSETCNLANDAREGFFDFDPKKLIQTYLDLCLIFISLVSIG